MIQRNFFILLLSSMLLSGCAATGKNFSNLLSGKNNSQVANQTVNYSVEWVDEATRGVLDKMEIMIIENNSTPEGKTIKAATVEIDIMIELSSLTPNSTRMKINIQYPKDQETKLTANEIFYQTRQFLLSNDRPERTGLE